MQTHPLNTWAIFNRKEHKGLSILAQKGAASDWTASLSTATEMSLQPFTLAT